MTKDEVNDLIFTARNFLIYSEDVLEKARSLIRLFRQETRLPAVGGLDALRRYEIRIKKWSEDRWYEGYTPLPVELPIPPHVKNIHRDRLPNSMRAALTFLAVGTPIEIMLIRWLIVNGYG